MKHRTCIAISGFVWFLSGGFLLYKGLHLINEATLRADTLCYRFQAICGSPQQAGTILIGIGLILGFIKGRFVLSKTVKRVANRIAGLTAPIRFSEAYSRSYWLLILSMIALGMSFRFLPIPIDARGLVDVAIGSALINGAMLFFRAGKAFQVSRE